MKRYRFRFGSVMRVRQIEEEMARSAMLEARQELEKASAALHARLDAISHARPAARTWTSPEFQDQRDQLVRHVDAVSAARAAEANALSLWRTRRTDWEEAAQRVRALERLDERHREAWLLEATRAAQQVTDEIATTRVRSEVD